MNSQFWGCFDCGDFIRGSSKKIQEHAMQHQSQCARKLTERENIGELVKGLHEFSSVLPPPPPPPQRKDLIQQKTPWYKEKATRIGDQKENMAPNDPRLKMPVKVVDELKDFMRNGKKLKPVLPQSRSSASTHNNKSTSADGFADIIDYLKVLKKKESKGKPLKRLQKTARHTMVAKMKN